MFHNILIVDDEAHVTEALETLLKIQTDIECAVFIASSAAEALDIATRERIDLMVSDIYMPQMSGLELLLEMQELWPVCQTIFLTGHTSFQNAYEAFQLKAAGFLLKTEDDEQILSKIREVLKKSDALLKQKTLFSDGITPAAEELGSFLSADNQRRADDLRRLSIVPEKAMVLCMVQGQTVREFAAIDTLIRRYMGKRVSSIRLFLDESSSCALWLFQDAASDVTPVLISDMLETVDTSYCATTGSFFSCVLAQSDLISFTRTYQEMLAFLNESADGQGSVAMLKPLQHKSSEYAVHFIKNYIKEHIDDEVTIPLLGSVTGYNADYLARIFRSQTGLTIGQYIINARLKRIRELMADPALSLDDIAGQTGFSSRSYFNRFIKRNAGVNPRSLRLMVQDEAVDASAKK